MKHNYSLLLTLLSLTLAMPVWADTATRQPFWQQPNAATLPPPSKPAISVAQSEAIQIYTLPDGRYHAEVSYQDQQNDQRIYDRGNAHRYLFFFFYIFTNCFFVFCFFHKFEYILVSKKMIIPLFIIFPIVFSCRFLLVAADVFRLNIGRCFHHNDFLVRTLHV